MNHNEISELSASRPESKISLRRTEIQDDIPFRSAGGASTGSFATPRMQHHFVPSSPKRFHSSEINDSTEARNGTNMVNGNVHGKHCGKDEVQLQLQVQDQHCQGKEIIEGAKSLTPNNGTEENFEEDDTQDQMCDSESDDDSETNGSLVSIGNENEEHVENILIEDEATLNGSGTHQEEIDRHDLEGPLCINTYTANGSNYVHLETIEQERNNCDTEDDDDDNDGEDCISKIDVSFCSDFSCEVEKLILLQNKSDIISPIKSQSLAKEDEGSSSSGSDWSDDELDDSGEDSNHERKHVEGEYGIDADCLPEGERSLLNMHGNHSNASGSNDFNESSISSSSASEIIGNGNGLGAMRSPWMQDYESSIESSKNTSLHDNTPQQKQTGDLNQADAKRSNEEGDDGVASPWTKYLDRDGLESSGCVSSISNHSYSTHLSLSTCASMQSPTLQHLEYLARNSTSANVASFTPKGRNTGRVPFTSPLQKASERITLKELHGIYGCKTRRDAMKLALDQSICLGAASSILVDLLFEYLQKFCDASTKPLFEDKRRSKKSSNPSHNGLSLPASAVGWLSSYLYPDESDHRYHQQWEGIQEEYCLPNASPAPQLQNKLSLLKVLLQKHVTHLRITNTIWPGRPKKGKWNANRGNPQNYETPRRRGRMLLNFDADSVSAFLRFYRLLQNQPRVDMQLFSSVEYVSFEGIPPGWIHNLRAVNNSMSRLTIQKGCLLNLPQLLEVNEQGLCNGNGKKDFDQSHGAIFEHGLYDSILHVATQQQSPVVKVPKALQGTIKNDNFSTDARIGEETNQNQAAFPMLKHLALSACSMNDASLFFCQDTGRPSADVTNSVLSHLQRLETIDMSHNEFTHAKSACNGLSNSTSLAAIDLSHNKLVSMDGSNLLLGNIKVLLLSNNNISDVCGLDCLYSLERLDLKYNRITNLCDVSGLAKLPDLMKLELKGNPLITKGKTRYRAHMLSLFKDSRVKDNGIGLTYRQVMKLLPTLDGTAVTKREIVMLKYLSFSQSIQRDCPVDSRRPTQRDESSATNNYQRSPLLRPFAEDYQDEAGVKSSGTIAVPIQPARRRVTRKAAYKPAMIGSDINDNDQQIHDNQFQSGTYSKVRLQRKALVVPTIPSIYLSLETVIESIANYQEEVNAHVNGPMLSNVDNGDSDDGSKSGESNKSSESSLEKECHDDSISPTKSKKYDASQDTIEKAGDNESSKKCIEEDSEVMDSLRQVSYDVNLSVEIMPFEGRSVCNYGIYDEISTCPTEIVKKSSALKDDARCADEENGVESKENESGLNNVSYSSATDLSNNEVDENIPSNTGSSCIDFAAVERNDEYDGPDAYSQLLISEYYELYFRCYVFRSTAHINVDSELYDDTDQEPLVPNVQLYQSDRDLMMWALAHKKDQQGIEEKLISVNRHIILPCGVAATTRIQPISSDVRGSKGSILFNNGSPHSISEGQNLLFCLSNRAVYLIPDFVVDYSDNRRFPSAIPADAQFSSSLWPHAYCRHPLKHLRKISFDGFGFQRLTLFFKLPGLLGAVYAQPENGLMSAFDYTYVIFTYNQHHTIKMLQCLQEAAKEACPNITSSSSLLVENDNRGTLQAISRALARTHFTDDILHYQIVLQYWDNTDHNARRSLVLTNSEVFLFHETYAGDLSACSLEEDISDIRYGDVSMRTIKNSTVQDIANVTSAKDDTKIVTIAFKPQSRLSWSPSSWFLKCQNVENAERLISDIRKVLSS